MIETVRSILKGMFPSVVPAGWWRDPSVRRVAGGDLTPRLLGARPLHRGERRRVQVPAVVPGRPVSTGGLVGRLGEGKPGDEEERRAVHEERGFADPGRPG
jgi:hypothetical protein